jgi:hypothetical protein
MTTPAGISPDSSSKPAVAGSRVVAGITMFLSVVFWLAIFGQLSVFAPMTEKLLGDYKARIPVMTSIVLRDFWWLVPVIGICAVIICGALRKKWAWGFGLLVLPLLVNSLVTFSLFIPTLQLLWQIDSMVRGDFNGQ